MASGPAEDAVSSFRKALAQFRSQLEGIEQSLPRGSGPVASAVREAKPGILPLSTPAPTPPQQTELSLLEYLITYGFKQQSFHDTTSVIAPNDITEKGDSYDAGQYWDSWIVVPTIDARISFEAAPSQNTPIITAGNSMNFEVRKQVIYYQAAVSGATGKLNIWLARY